MIKNKSVLVTGISGFVGSHLAKYLVAIGASVYGLVRRRRTILNTGELIKKLNYWKAMCVIFPVLLLL